MTPYGFYTLAEAEAMLDKYAPTFADTETVGLYGKVRLLQLYQEGMDHVIFVEYPDNYEMIVMLTKFDTKWHNAHYDITTIQQQSGTRWVPTHFDDTFLLARLAFPEKEKFSLDEVMQYCLGHCPYVKQGLDKKKLQKTNWGALKLTDEQLQYAATDVYYMPAVWDAVCNSLDESSYKLDMLTLRYCLDFQWNGMPVDDDKLSAIYEANEAKIAEYKMPINVNSWQQVRPYIGEDESDGLALATQTLQGNERSKAVQAVRKLIKQQSFLKKFDTLDGRIFGKFLPSARSGRLTSKDQNLQQLPRALKGAFGCEEGNVLIYADYAQLELRTICAITTCTMMIDLFRKGEDLHGFTAEMIFGKDWTKAHRQLSKTYNFSFLYGGGINMLISILILTAGVLLDERQANKDRARWRNLWREIYAWQEKGISMWRKGRLGSTPMGRRYKAKMMTDQLNIENQGAGAEVAKLALHYYYPKLMAYNAEHGVEYKLCNFIHDSFITEGPNDPVHYEAIAKMKAEAMQEAWFEMSKLFAVKDLPMPVQVLVGTNWGDIENDDEPNIYEYELEEWQCMQNFERDYANLVSQVLIEGEDRETRNMSTRSIFGSSLSFDLRDSFPLLEGRKIFYKGVLGEFAALLRRPKCLEDFKFWGCNYWEKWANPDGSINVDYGNAWFDFEGFDQIADLKDKLKNNPADRRMIINAWRPHKLDELSLPCCHYSYQFHVSTEGVLNMVWTQRSVDVMIGLPSDMVLAAAWMISLAAEFGFTPGVCKMDFGDTHIYSDHVTAAIDYVSSAHDVVTTPVKWQYATKGEDFCKFTPDHLILSEYKPRKNIKFNLHG